MHRKYFPSEIVAPSVTTILVQTCSFIHRLYRNYRNSLRVHILWPPRHYPRPQTPAHEAIESIHKATCLNKKRGGARHHDFWRENFLVWWKSKKHCISPTWYHFEPFHLLFTQFLKRKCKISQLGTNGFKRVNFGIFNTADITKKW